MQILPPQPNNAPGTSVRPSLTKKVGRARNLDGVPNNRCEALLAKQLALTLQILGSIPSAPTKQCLGRKFCSVVANDRCGERYPVEAPIYTSCCWAVNGFQTRDAGIVTLMGCQTMEDKPDRVLGLPAKQIVFTEHLFRLECLPPTTA